MNAADAGANHRAFIALGSNIDPERHLPLALQSLYRLGRVLSVSAVYESPPVDGSDQPNYLNAAALLQTNLSAEALCRELLPAVEDALGRQRDPFNRNAARTIDLDLALYDDAILTIDHRRIPDPDIAERAFLIIPLAELDEAYCHPTSGLSLGQLAQRHREQRSLTRRDDVVWPLPSETVGVDGGIDERRVRQK